MTLRLAARSIRAAAQKATKKKKRKGIHRMKMRFRFKPRGEKPRTITVSVPRHAICWTPKRLGGSSVVFTREVRAAFIERFEARHSAEVLEIRRPSRRAR